jgi:hypothetical protein
MGNSESLVNYLLHVIAFVEDNIAQHVVEDLQCLRGDVRGVASQEHPQLQQADPRGMFDHHLVLSASHPPAQFVEHLHRISAATDMGREKQSLRTFCRRKQRG